jgi:hypothetical protein
MLACSFFSQTLESFGKVFKVDVVLARFTAAASLFVLEVIVKVSWRFGKLVFIKV